MAAMVREGKVTLAILNRMQGRDAAKATAFTSEDMDEFSRACALVPPKTGTIAQLMEAMANAYWTAAHA